MWINEVWEVLKIAFLLVQINGKETSWEQISYTFILFFSPFLCLLLNFQVRIIGVAADAQVYFSGYLKAMSWILS